MTTIQRTAIATGTTDKPSKMSGKLIRGSPTNGKGDKIAPKQVINHYYPSDVKI